MNLSTSILWSGQFQVEGMSGKFLFIPCFIEILICNANSVEPDQTSRSDLGLFSDNFCLNRAGGVQLRISSSQLIRSGNIKMNRYN